MGRITAMLLHRIIRFVCLTGAATAPLVAALFCRFFSRVAVKHIVPLAPAEPLPELTQIWITGVADGSFPIVVIALLLSALVVTLGLYTVLSKRLSPEAAGSALALVCCISYVTAVVLVGSTLIALVIPFIPMVAE